MYGTVVRFRLKPGMEEQLLALTREEVEAVPNPGFVAACISRSETEPAEYHMTVLFESKAAYVAHANAPEAHTRYQHIAALLEGAPEWHDGEVVYVYPRQEALLDARNLPA